MSDNSTSKLRILVRRKPDGRPWAHVELLKYGPPHPEFVPSFHDLHRIVQALAYCEDESYPPPRYKGRVMLADFFELAVYERDFARIAQRLNIPERSGDVVVKTNGANLSRHTNGYFRQLTLFDKLRDQF